MTKKTDFFKATELSTGVVSVEGFGNVELRELTLKQRLSLKDLGDASDDVSRAKVVIMSCELFNDDDVDALCEIKSDVLLTLFTEAMRLSGIGNDSKKKR
ncbi:MAG: hypothetical protein DRH08_01070 [Deltaproteobacteria bacterium]|nr:MAG: hypothetical protein DRH08_01070 [Deltaproteobacteria bacterium]